MSRDASGNYTLPIGNPVSPGTIITTSWANSTLGDIGTALTDSLSRSGKGGMTAPLRGIDGNAGTPSVSFNNETNLGFFRPSTGDVGFATNGIERIRFESSGRLAIGGLGTTMVAGALTVGRDIDSGNDSAIALGSVVRPGTPGSVFGIRSALGGAASSSVTSLAHYAAEQGVYSGTVGVQAGFVAGATLVVGTANYGFRGQLPAGTGRWNLFMDGTAPSFLAGDLRLGAQAAREVGGVNQPLLLIEGTSGAVSALVRNSADAAGPAYTIAKTRSGAVSGNTIVLSGDTLGALQFAGADGTGLVVGAEVRAEVDAAPGVNVMPARLVLRAANAAGAVAERARVDGTGVRVGASADTGYVVAQPTFRNRIHNPFGLVNRREAASYSVTGGGRWTLDRWYGECSGARAFVVVQTTDAPPGFPGSIIVTTTAFGSPAAGDLAWIGQGVEGFNIADFRWGTPDAQPVTIGFWFRSSVAGLHSAFVLEGGLTRSYAQPFTVNVANTWEYKTISVPAETTATWRANNLAGLFLGFDLGSGSNFNTASPGTWDVGRRQRTSGTLNLLGSAATIQYTGVQIERGTIPTVCERRDYATELAICQRYYRRRSASTSSNERLTGSGLVTFGGTVSQGYFQFDVPMRATPSMVVNNATSLVVYDGVGAFPVSGAVIAEAGAEGVNVYFTHAAGGTPGRACHITRNGAATPAPFIEFSADI